MNALPYGEILSDGDGIQAALLLAQLALPHDVPVGAVLVDPAGQLIGWGYNQRESRPDPTAHAELIALRMASKRTAQWRLTDLTCYVTLEPCPMCASALFQARVKAVVFGAFDPVMGACGSRYDLLSPKHGGGSAPQRVTGGILESECRHVLQNFFKEKQASKP
ncbi:MAG: nucleoside deaminase [Vampirovibrionales bacterium]|nr:nucleoside deaminase [Vampirovibrionales bacterium]